MITEGIDVSLYQGDIDWQKVAKSGIDFAMIKAGQGHALSSDAYLFADRYFKKNIKEAYKNGITCGAYYYVTATTVEEAEKQAKHFLSIIRPYRNSLALWAAADVEDVTPPKYCGRLTPRELTDVVLKFCDTVEKDGFKSMLYTNRDYLKNHLEAERLTEIPLWRAHWRSGVITPADAPTDYAENMKIWQYGTSELDGVGICTDANYGYFTAADIVKGIKQRGGRGTTVGNFLGGKAITDAIEKLKSKGEKENE